MDAIVTARVPVEIKEQGSSVLKAIGATPTQLVNAAYRFLLAEKQLPHTDNSLESLRGTHRHLTASQKKEIAQALKKMYVGPSEGKPFKEELAAARDERYASLA